MSGSENLAIDYRKNEAYDVLVDQDDIFESYTQLLIFAAAVGYARGRFDEDVEADAQTKWYYIKGDNRLEVAIASMAYSHSRDTDVLTDLVRQFDILVGFGAGGAEVLLEEVVEQPGENLDLLIQLIQDQRDSEEMQRQLGILEEIDVELTTFSGGAD